MLSRFYELREFKDIIARTFLATEKTVQFQKFYLSIKGTAEIWRW